MHLGDLKRWQWAIVGLLAGLAAGFAFTLSQAQRDSVMRRPLSAEQFVAGLNAPQGLPGSVHDLVIGPAEDGGNLVTGEVLLRGEDRPFAFYATRPFVAAPDVHANSVLDYVTSIKQTGRDIIYRNPWWQATWIVLTVSALAGLAVIGGVWPTIINLILLGSLHRPAQAKDAYDLERFVAEPPTPPVEKKRLTRADEDRLCEIEKQIESSLSQNSVPAAVPAASSAIADNVVKLSSGPLQASAPQLAQDPKEYQGEFYPVVKPHEHHKPHAPGFSLVELLVVIGIISILISILIPAIHRAQQSAQVSACANNLRQIGIALQGYLNENELMTFWRADNINLNGMDWYAFGGRPDGNANQEQANYFNTSPRPLNRYLNNNVNIFHCPCDDAAPWTHDPTITAWPAESQFDWVGNSYSFNANGYPLRPPPRHDGGLDGIRFSSVGNSSQTIVFYEACLYWGADWHYAHKANVAFADGHVRFAPMPSQIGQLRWDP
jgi:prepilin-type N-terminal cleavage/methylation domain-containing protein/prepilin-type processing-associated H-X9-DG protein